MNELKLILKDGRTQLRPGDALQVAAGWQMESAPESAEIRLFWHTRGKGTEDLHVVETVTLPAPQASDARTATLELPQGPYSFAGKLIAIVWGVELVLSPGDVATRAEFSVSADGEEAVFHP